MDKNVLKKFAIESRQELMEKVANKINRYFVDEEFNVNQNGEVYVLVNDKHTLRLTKSEYENRQLLVKRIKEITLEQVIEEAAYTWFNRIIAIRYMEIHDYLPLTKDNQSLGVRVLSSKDNTPDPEIMKISNLISPDLDISFNKEYYGTIQDNNKRFEYILLLVCKKLGKVIPQVFDGITDYIDILIPDNLLNDSGYVTKLLNDVSEDNFEQVEIIGWLYQYYNQSEKDRVMSENRAYKKSEIAFVTQLFTPDWIVKYMVENSLGRYWIEHGGNESVANKWKYYINTEYQKNNRIDPIEIKCIDPCCGSGHILVYYFEVLYQIYESFGYSKKDIAELILKNNLFGLDIDDRAGQLSILSVLLKAREYDKYIFSKNFIKNINIVSMQETNAISNENIKEIKIKENIDNANYLIENFKNAKEYGSLIKLEKRNYQNLINEIENNNSIFGIELKEKLLPVIKIAKILQNQYDIIVTNPPYLNSSMMSEGFKKYMDKNYTHSKSDLCVSFMEIEMLKQEGYYGIINQHSWMFLNSFEKFRNAFIENYSISSMIHLGTRAFEEINGEVVQTTTFVFNKKKQDKNSIFIRLVDYDSAAKKELNAIKSIQDKAFYIINEKEFLKIPGSPIAYWVSPNLVEAFTKNKKLEQYIDARIGMVSGDNNRFLRFWQEIEFDRLELNAKPNSNVTSNKKWFPLQKGGGFRKWYGNLEYVVNWENNGYEIQNDNFAGKRPRGHNFNGEQIFKKGITWNSISTSNFICRYSDEGFIFDAAGPLCEIKEEELLYYILGFLSSNTANTIFKFINPTINFTPGYINSIPLKIGNIDYITEIVKENIDICKKEWDFYENSWCFKRNQLIDNNATIKESVIQFNNNILELRNKLKNNEEKINEYFIDLYDLKNELTKEVEDKLISIRIKNNLDLVKEFISYFVGCLFGRYSLDEDGLIYAGGEFNKEKYKTFEVDVDNIIPLTEENYFGDDIVSRFKKFIEVVYGKGTLYENLEFIAETLGKKNGENSEETIRRYFINDFYNDHVKMYQKRPIYWLFDSGKKNGFKCLIYMHRYNEGLVSKIRLDYLHRMQNTYEKELKEITDKLNNDVDLTSKRELSKRQADLSSKLQETNEYDEKIAHIADQKIKIDLDDGVAVNYAKFSVKNPKTGKDESILAKIK